MSALARTAPTAVPRHPTPVMLGFDAWGQIRWMNAAAREAFGRVTGVASLLASPQPDPPLACLPLGRHWLWLGGLAEDPWEERLRSADHLLAEMRSLCRDQYWKLVRAHELVLEFARHATERRLLRQSAAAAYQKVDDERNRISRDLHDTVSQSLIGIKLNLELVENQFDAANAEAFGRLKRSQELVSTVLEQIRSISHGLRTPDWEECEFAEAVESLVEEMAIHSRMAVEIGPIDIPKNVQAAIKDALYAVLQEGLSNVVKHSGARHVRIEAQVVSGYAVLIIEDDGRGFDPVEVRAAGGGTGLKNMRERIEALGGHLEIQAKPGQGVRLSARIPAGGRTRAAGAG